MRVEAPLPDGRGSDSDAFVNRMHIQDRGLHIHDRMHCKRSRDRKGAGLRGQAALEFALLYSAVLLPLTFMIVFVAEMVWTWHSVVDFTRAGAQFAATHCWSSDASATNVINWMETHVPPMIDQQQFQTNAAGIQVQYFSQASDGTLTPLSGCSDGGAICEPDVVSVSITTYQFTRFSSFFKLGAVQMPPFTTTIPMESGGYQVDPTNPATAGTCVADATQ